MESPVGVGAKTGGRNVGKDKGVKGEGSGFWMKLRMLFACMALGSTAEHRSLVDTNSNNEQDKGKKPIRDNGKAPLVVEASPINKNNPGTSGFTPNLIRELQQYSQLRQFTFYELKLATKNFKDGNFLGEGGFGTVHKGWITQNDCSPSRPGVGIPIAVKTLNIEGNQGHKEWVAEVSNLGTLEHPNLVKLVGYCIEGDNRVLVYEFMPRGSLEHHLFRRALPLPWSMRLKILIGAAKGLAFLHEEAKKPLIYRDFKTSNILLDSDYNAKLSDFGLVKDAPTGDLTHVSTRVMGTQGYAAPEYVMTGHLSSKSDVYSFGVVLLEILTGRRTIDKKRPVAEHHLVEWARPKKNHGGGAQYQQLMDPKLDGHYSIKGAQKSMRLAYQCLSKDPKSRPLMSQVVQGLQCASQYTTDLACASPSYHPIMKQKQGQGAPSSSSSKSASVNNIATNKYGLRSGPSAGSTPSRFQASPLSFTPPFPSPEAG